jgi:hypothetical protein
VLVTDSLIEYNELRIGDFISPANRMVIAYTKRTDRVLNDTYASWVAICAKQDELHPYVVWTIIARPTGFVAESGDYCLTLEEAVKAYKKRGGEA